MKDNVSELRSKESGEPIAAFLGTKLVDLEPGYAKVTIKIKPEHLNFNGLVFGGIITSVIDEAFAYATNSLIQPSYASQLNIHFINAPVVNDTLIAECWLLKSGHRVGISEMVVTNQEGKLIAKAMGTTIPVVREPDKNDR
jgi:acyl-CoA thioesterase